MQDVWVLCWIFQSWDLFVGCYCKDERKKMQHRQKKDSSLHYAKLDA